MEGCGLHVPAAVVLSLGRVISGGLRVVTHNALFFLSVGLKVFGINFACERFCRLCFYVPVLITFCTLDNQINKNKLITNSIWAPPPIINSSIINRSRAKLYFDLLTRHHSHRCVSFYISSHLIPSLVIYPSSMICFRVLS